MTTAAPISDFTWYHGNLTWLRERTIYLVKHGSQAYGTSLPTSDLDIKGVAIPPPPYFLGSLHRFEQAESKDPDAVVFDIRKFVALAADCNPNIIEILFVDESDFLITSHWSDVLREHRDLFLSKRAQNSFSGYAMAQLKRIKTHRRWLLEPPTKHPERTDFGLSGQHKVDRDSLAAVEARVRKAEDKLGGEGWTKDRVAERDELLVTSVAGELDLAPKLIPLILAERRYGNAMRNWVACEKWKAERNPKRAELEARHGYDTKHGMHLVRLMRMALEIIGEQRVLVRRPDAGELLAIRGGAWSYDRLMAWAEETERRLAEIALTSTLRKEPDREAIDGILVGIVSDYLARH